MRDLFAFVAVFLRQDMENKIRNTLNDIYFSKTKDIVNGLRSTVPAADTKHREMLKNDLASALQKRNQAASNWVFCSFGKRPRSENAATIRR